MESSRHSPQLSSPEEAAAILVDMSRAGYYFADRANSCPSLFPAFPYSPDPAVNAEIHHANVSIQKILDDLKSADENADAGAVSAIDAAIDRAIAADRALLCHADDESSPARANHLLDNNPFDAGYDHSYDVYFPPLGHGERYAQPFPAPPASPGSAETGGARARKVAVRRLSHKPSTLPDPERLRKPDLRTFTIAEHCFLESEVARRLTVSADDARAMAERMHVKPDKIKRYFNEKRKKACNYGSLRNEE